MTISNVYIKILIHSFGDSSHHHFSSYSAEKSALFFLQKHDIFHKGIDNNNNIYGIMLVKTRRDTMKRKMTEEEKKLLNQIEEYRRQGIPWTEIGIMIGHTSPFTKHKQLLTKKVREEREENEK